MGNYISNRLPNRYFPKIDIGCPWLWLDFVVQPVFRRWHSRDIAAASIHSVNNELGNQYIKDLFDLKHSMRYLGPQLWSELDSNVRNAPSLVPSRPRQFRMWRHLSSLSGKFAIALGSKPPLVTRIARTGLGTRLERTINLRNLKGYENTRFRCFKQQQL